METEVQFGLVCVGLEMEREIARFLKQHTNEPAIKKKYFKSFILDVLNDTNET